MDDSDSNSQETPEDGAGYVIKEVALTSIMLDHQNPRHEVAANEREAIRTMLESDEDKLVRLAQHIVTAGLNPAESLIVLQHPEDQERYIVLEGNRRITALKLLSNPDLLPGGVKAATKRRIQELSKDFRIEPVEKVRCVVFASRDEANRWIRLRHTGENNGVGIVAWGSKERTRFNERFGETSAALRVIELVRERGSLTEEARARIDDIALTNMERIVHDRGVRDTLGYNIVNGQIETGLPDAELLKPLTKIVEDLALRKINVNDIRSKEDRQNYVKSFAVNDLPDSSQTTKETRTVQTSGGNVTPATTNKTPRTRPAASQRTTVIPSSCSIAIKVNRLNEIYRELKSLRVGDFPNAASVLLRVFLELSSDYYVTAKSLPAYPNDTLSKKTQRVAQHFKDNKIMTDHELKPVYRATANTASQHNLFSIDTLHAYVHNPHLNPKPDELKSAWDDMQLFVQKIWST